MAGGVTDGLTCSADEKGCLSVIKLVINDGAIKTKRCLIRELIPFSSAFVLRVLWGKHCLPKPQSSSVSALSTPGSAQVSKNFFWTYKSCSQVPQALEDPISSCPWWWPEAPGACCSIPGGRAASRLGFVEERTHLFTAGPPKLRDTICPGHALLMERDGHLYKAVQPWTPVWEGKEKMPPEHDRNRNCLYETPCLCVSAGEWDDPRPWSLCPSGCRGLTTTKDWHFFKL